MNLHVQSIKKPTLLEPALSHQNKRDCLEPHSVSRSYFICILLVLLDITSSVRTKTIAIKNGANIIAFQRLARKRTFFAKWREKHRLLKIGTKRIVFKSFEIDQKLLLGGFRGS